MVREFHVFASSRCIDCHTVPTGSPGDRAGNSPTLSPLNTVLCLCCRPVLPCSVFTPLRQSDGPPRMCSTPVCRHKLDAVPAHFPAGQRRGSAAVVSATRSSCSHSLAPSVCLSTPQSSPLASPALDTVSPSPSPCPSVPLPSPPEKSARTNHIRPILA